MRCALGEAALVTQGEVARYDAIALVTTARGAYALWSDKRGLAIKALSKQRREAVRLGEPCRGGLAAIDQHGLRVACARPAEGDRPGSLWLLGLDAELQPSAPRQLAELGRDARGVALGKSADSLFIAYADGAVGGPRVLLIEIAGAAVKPAQALSAPQQNGREPTLVVANGSAIVAFTATELGAQGARHRLMIARQGQPAKALHEIKSASPTPVLSLDEQGLVIAFRDVPRPKARAELFIARIDAELKLAERPHSLGRANAHGAPSLALCKKTRAAAVPIDHAGELYIAFHPLSNALRTVEANHQYYESEHEFVETSTKCVGDHPLALIAERSEAIAPSARLLAAEFRCTQ